MPKFGSKTKFILGLISLYVYFILHTLSRILYGIGGNYSVVLIQIMLAVPLVMAVIFFVGIFYRVVEKDKTENKILNR